MLHTDVTGYKPCSEKIVDVTCDYCQTKFTKQYVKWRKGRATIQKDACGNRACVTEKTKECNAINYIEGHPKRTKKVNDKIKATCLEKYGVDNPAKTQASKDKIKQTCLEKYGVEHHLQDPTIMQKSKDTYAANHNGSKSYFGTPEYKKQMLDKYGVENPNHSPIVREKIKQTSMRLHGVTCTLNSASSRQKAIASNLARFGQETYPTNHYGKTEKEVVAFLNANGGNFISNRSTLGNGQELDGCDSSLKLAVEYCGVYWHCTKFRPDPKYHYNKYKLCADNGITLITIFEDEWRYRQDQVKGYLLSKIRAKSNQIIYGRECTVEILTTQEANTYLDLWHIQGSTKLSTFCVGLKFNNEFVGVMTFGLHHRNTGTTTDIVLTRMAFKSGVSVLGGSEKMFKFSLKNLPKTYKRIVSWSDNRWSNGNVYQKLGFTLNKELPIDYSYVNQMQGRMPQRKSKQSCSKKALGIQGSETTENEATKALGYYRIYDCGKKRWVYNL